MPQGRGLPHGCNLSSCNGVDMWGHPIIPSGDMFESYDATNPNDMPNNMYPPLPPPPPIPVYYVKQPYILYNQFGDFIGFSWYYGDAVTLEFSYDPDMIFITPDGSQTTFGEYLVDKTIQVRILNWRLQEVLTNVIAAESESKAMKIDITPSDSAKIVRGLYYLEIKVQSEDDTTNDADSLIVLSPDDALLQVV